MEPNSPEISPGGTLVYIIHGLRGTEETLQDLRQLALESYPNATVKAPTLPHSSLFSITRADALVADLIARITKTYGDGQFDRVVLIGHSMGAVLARRIVIEASGLDHHWTGPNNVKTRELRVENRLASVEPCAWSDKVELLVMMASVSRGWSVDNAKNGWQRFKWNIGGAIGHLMPERWKPTLFDFRKGCPFIVQTRLRWLEYCKQKGKNRPKLVQFLGTTDEVAPPNDSIDFATDGNGELFSQVEIPNTGHKDILDLGYGGGGPARKAAQRARRKRIISAVLQGRLDDYADFDVKREYLLDELPPRPDPHVENLVFVIHGIRDNGYWTKKIAAKVKDRGFREGCEYVSRTPSYGYFPILPFLLRWYRRQKVEWLMDQYVEAAAAYPKADFHYMGHSNGTYLGARALLDYPMASFKRIMFAGSVVRPDFPWKRLVNAGKVDRILNLVATSDVVVALFPHGLRNLQGLFDLGGAGHRGFQEQGLPGALFQMDSPSRRDRRDFVRGGHRAARQEDIWDEIADFIVTGVAPEAGHGNPNFASDQPWYSKLLGAVSPLIVLVLAAVILFLGAMVIAPFLTVFGLPGLADNPYLIDLWNTWQDQHLSTHIVGVLAYVFALRFLALRL